MILEKKKNYYSILRRKKTYPKHFFSLLLQNDLFSRIVSKSRDFQMYFPLLSRIISDMGWLRFIGSLKLSVSFAKEPYKRDDILQKRPIILRSLLIEATP